MQSGGGDECPSFGHLAGHGRERERDICGGDILVEECGSWDFGKDWNFGKWKREIILLEEKVKNNDSGGFPGFSCGCGNLSGKYRNRPKFKCLGTTRKIYQKSIIIF